MAKVFTATFRKPTKRAKSVRNVDKYGNERSLAVRFDEQISLLCI